LAKDVVEYLEGSISSLSLKTFFIYAICIIIFRTLSRFLFFYPARLIQYSMRLDLLKKIQGCFPKRIEDFSKGQLYQLLVSDIDQIRAFLGFAALQVLNIVIALSILLPKLYKYNSQLLIALLPLVFSMLIFTYFISKNKKNYTLSQKLSGDIQQFIVETFVGKKTIKNFHYESNFISNFEERSQEELNNFWTASKRVSFTMPLFSLGIGISFIWGSFIIFKLNLGVSSLVLFSGFIFLFLEPISFLSWISVVFIQSKSAWDRLNKLATAINTETNLEIELDKLNENILNKETTDVVVQCKVNYWDSTSEFVFKNKLNYAFVGSTGCGKSFVLEEIAYVLKKNNRISYVGQEPYLFDDTLINNIVLGKEIDDQLIKNVRSLINLFELDSLGEEKDILDLKVGENGKLLSGGQAKRVALIRSLIIESEFIVWDDPFSSVDIIQERQIWNELNSKDYFKNKIIIFSTHRYTTLLQADHIYFCNKVNSLITNEENNSETIRTFFEEQII